MNKHSLDIEPEPVNAYETWWRSYPTFAAITFALTVATILWFLLLHSGQNFQEQYNLQLINHHVGLASAGSPDDPMPLYYLLLHVYTLIIGHANLYAARSLSLICLLSSVIAGYIVGTRMSGNPIVGRLSAVMLAVSPFVIWYASRATMYSLLLLIGLVNQYFFSVILQRPKWWHWAGYFLSGALGLGVHYFFGLVLLLELIFFIIKFHNYRALKLWLLIGCQIILALGFVVWLHYSLANNNYWHFIPFTTKPSATNAFILYVQFLFGFQTVLTTTFIIAFWPLLVILALLAIQKYVQPSVGVQYAMWASLAPMLVVFASAWITSKPLFLTSYLSVSVAPFLLLISWYFVAFGLRILILVRNALVGIMILSFFAQLHNEPVALQQDYLGEATTQAHK